MIYKELNCNQFIHEFLNSSYKNNFSCMGLRALYEYIDECGVDHNLDIVALCSEFIEYTPDELLSGFSLHGDSLDAIVDSLEDEATLIKFDGGYIVAQ